MKRLQEAGCIHDTREQVVRLCPNLMNIMGEKPIVQLAFLADPNNTSNNCGTCENKAVWNLSYLLSDFAREVYEAYNTNGMITDAHI